MNIKKAVSIALLGVGFLGLSNVANAACSFTGKIERVYQTATNTYVYMLPQTSLSSSYYRYFRTTDADLSRAVHAAHEGNRYVNVRGNARTCPSTGTGRYGGVITSVTRY